MDQARVVIAYRFNGLFERIRGLLDATFDQLFAVVDKPSLIEGALRLQPTVIVIDLSYAEGNLADFLRELREIAPQTKVLLVSGYDEPTVVAAAIAAGADGLVLKRELAGDLLPAIDTLLAGRRYFNSGATQ
jgi:DNA-binding NarL/FixJ family response regulator